MSTTLPAPLEDSVPLVAPLVTRLELLLITTVSATLSPSISDFITLSSPVTVNETVAPSASAVSPILKS